MEEYKLSPPDDESEEFAKLTGQAFAFFLFVAAFLFSVKILKEVFIVVWTTLFN